MKPNGYPAMAEASQTQTEYIAEVLHSAQRSVIQLTNNEEFHADCHTKGIDPYDDLGTEQYWDTFAGFAGKIVSDAHGKTLEEGYDPLAIDAFELLAITPEFLYKHDKLQKHEGSKDHSETIIASNFNALIRMFAFKHPDTPVSALHKGLLDMAQASVEDPALLKSSAEFIDATIRGTQHELAFGQTLAHTGRKHRAATLEEDLSGFDYEVQGRWPAPLRVDVKASTHQMNGQPFKYRSNGTVMMRSIASDNEFHDRFFIPDTLATSRGHALKDMLNYVEVQRPGRR